MPFVHRRVFYAKVGQADQLVRHFQEAEQMWQEYNPPYKARILTDYFSGRSDRVVYEWEVENMADLDAFFNRVMQDPQAQQSFGGWESRMNEFIHYADAETWSIR